MSPKRTKLPGSTVDRLGATYNFLLGKKRTSALSESAKTINRDVRDALVPQDIRQEMAYVLEIAAHLGLSTGRLSEASIQFQENHYLVTRKDSWLSALDDNDLIYASAGSSIADDDQTPAFWDRHLRIYQNSQGTKAILFAQPAAVMALAVDQKLPDAGIFLSAAELLGESIICSADPADISDHAGSKKLLIVPNIGVFSHGDSIRTAVIQLEVLNRCSEITLLANR